MTFSPESSFKYVHTEKNKNKKANKTTKEVLLLSFFPLVLNFKFLEWYPLKKYISTIQKPQNSDNKRKQQ